LRVLTGQPEALPAKSQTEPYLTLRQVSHQLGLSVTTLWRYDIPGHTLGGRRRFRLSEVLRYLDSDEFKTQAEALKVERAAGKRCLTTRADRAQIQSVICN